MITVRTELSAQPAGAWKVAELNSGLGEIPKHFTSEVLTVRAGVGWGMALVVRPCLQHKCENRVWILSVLTKLDMTVNSDHARAGEGGVCRQE